MQDPLSEGGVPAFLIDLYDETGETSLATTTTDGDGRYSFSGLADGVYQLTFHSGDNYMPDAGTVASNGYSWISNIVVQNGEVTTLNEGFFQGAHITGHITQALSKADSIEVVLLDSEGQLVSTTNTQDDSYTFNYVRPGAYIIQVVGSDHGVEVTPQSRSVQVGLGENMSDVDFAITDPANDITISGLVYQDENGDHQISNGEAGIGGVNVLLQSADGTAIATTVTDAQGHYQFVVGAAGAYNVVFGALKGLTGVTGPNTSVKTGELVAGQIISNVGQGLVTDQVSDKTGHLPSHVTQINVVIRGQSNTEQFTYFGFNEVLKRSIEKLLGFDGVNEKVNVIANGSTEHGGTSMIKDWLHPIDGNYLNGWEAASPELELLSCLGKLSAEQKSAPTVIVSLDNETDSFQSDLTLPEWESAFRYEAGLVRAVLGQDASSAPYMFVNAIPFISEGRAYQPTQNQTIRVGQQDLINDKSFNASYAVNQSSDVTMNVGYYLDNTYNDT